MDHLQATSCQKSISKISSDAVSRSEQGFESLLKSWEPFINVTAKRYRHRCLEWEDLLQIGRIAFWRALNKFDPERGDFRPYAKRAINNAMLQGLRQALRRPEEIPFGEELEIDDEFDGRRAPLDLRSAPIELQLQTRLWIKGLPKPLRSIIGLIYLEGKTQREVARQKSMTQPRVSQLCRKLQMAGATEFDRQ